MPKIITIANQKGGVAKTTTTRHLADRLEQLGARVLAVDNDQQANLTQYFGLDPVELDRTNGTMYHVVAGERSIEDVFIWVSDKVHVVPSALSLAVAAARLVLETDVNGVVKSALESVKNNYDVILIDCGPNLERLLINALVASNLVLIPTKTDGMSISGIRVSIAERLSRSRARPTTCWCTALPPRLVISIWQFWMTARRCQRGQPTTAMASPRRSTSAQAR